MVESLHLFNRYARKQGFFFLDTSLDVPQARSFLGFDPVDVIEHKNIDGIDKVRALGQKHRCLAVGLINYEGSIHFGLYPRWVEINHGAGVMRVHAPSHREARQFLMAAEYQSSHKVLGGDYRARVSKAGIKSNFNRIAYMRAVKQVLAAIQRGDMYQMNLSRQVQQKIMIDPVHFYLTLRGLSPSAFSAYYAFGQGVLISSSPERFLRLQGRQVSVRPMKGTRPRGKNKQEDKRFYEDLLHSPKEIAELLMVTDLERNDLGRICKVGSVRVAKMRAIERYKNVFQATALVEGELKSGVTHADVIKATFPSGSVTGCPKIEAMKWIKRIEKIPRGFYTGALGYIDPKGSMDLSVLIRSVMIKPGLVTYHVGGGIVADSDPAAEYTETILKAQAIEEAIKRGT